MSYGFNLKGISLKEFKTILKESYLIPSMRVLLEDLDKHLDLLTDYGIENMSEFYLQSKTKKKAEVLAEKTGMDLDYMIVLRRMVSSYIPKPRKLEDFTDMNDDLLKRLIHMGIKNSLALDDYLKSHSEEEAAAQLAVDVELIKTFKKLLKVSELRYISPAFATVLVRGGYDTIDKLAQADSKTLLKTIVDTNKKFQIYKGNIGDSDSRFIIDDAKIYLKYS
ncbi:DUF4332 domain-containing protein [Acidaminobacter sp. JC074]|uniref:DUF4332 domain-containing protein n=1 Tax=Acidaminobacter sp. JC074 TaxID=2530199 RepID=UPI001F0E1298|nr:DUF4332 domain-containing protein [Acidaminobacter sp. JC074]MCH4890936.1 DUF4332 domain-containing protein [Acidaminobacter sp. JC074]